MPRDPLIVQATRRYRLALLAHEEAQMATMARWWVRVERNLQASMEALAADVLRRRQAGQPVTLHSLYTLQRYNDLLAQVAEQYRGFVGRAAGSIRAGQTEAVRLASEAAQAEIGAAMRRPGVVSTAFDRLNVEALSHLVGAVSDGSPLADYLMATYPQAADRMAELLVEGTAKGWNPKRIASAMMGQGLGIGYQTAIRTARTEQLRAYRTATLDQFRASGVVRGYRRLASKSLRTCPACLMLDGQFYELATSFQEHVQGRCTLVSVMDGWNDKAPEWETGQSWFERQPERDQRAMLGPGLWALWDTGLIGLPDIPRLEHDPVWGDYWRPITVREAQQ